MSRLAEQFGKDGLIVLAVNAWNEPKSVIVEFVGKRNLKHRILLEGRDVMDQYGVSELPTVLWINRDGMMVDADLTFDAYSDKLERKARGLLRRNR